MDEIRALLVDIRQTIKWLIKAVGFSGLCVMILFAVLLFSGCSNKEQVPATKVIVKEVRVPVAVNCLDKKDVPKYDEYVTVKINKADSDYTKVRKLIVRDFEHQKFAKVAEAAMKGCSE